MLPWGIPTGTICWVDWQFSTDVTWYRLSRYEANHFTTWELAPMVLSFSTRSTWSTMSKAFKRSKKTVPVNPPLPRLCSMLSVKWARAVTVESLGWKPNWFGVSNSFADKNSRSVNVMSVLHLPFYRHAIIGMERKPVLLKKIKCDFLHGRKNLPQHLNVINISHYSSHRRK